MSSLYNKNYIYSYNQKELLDILNGKTFYTLNITNLYERRKYITLQHFLIKYLEKHGKTKNIKELLKKYYSDFIQYPYLFADSPLLNQSFINRFISLKDRKQILKLKNSYYDPKENTHLSELVLSNNKLSNNQKNRLYAYLVTLLRSNDTKYNDILERHARLILNSNKKINELSEMETKFYCLYVAKHAGRDVLNSDLHLINTDPKLYGSQLHNIIFINTNANNSKELWEITKIIYHETRHAYQEKQAYNKTSRVAFEMTRHILFSKYLNTKEFNLYKENYRYIDIELDAEGYALIYSEVFLKTFDREDLSIKVNELKNATSYQRHFYEIMYNEKGIAISPDAFTVDYLDKIVKEHPEELKTYKVLQNLYNKDGSKKSLSNLIAHRINESLEDRGIYDNYINYEIVKNRLFEIDMINTKPEVNKKIFKSLGDIYIKKSELFKDYCSDTKYKEMNEKQIRLTTLYELQIIYNILSFIDYNMNSLLEHREIPISSTSFIYNFIYEFIDFNYDNMNNEVIKNDPLIKERFKKLLDKRNSVVKKYNEQYIKDRIDDLSIEERHKIIKTPEGITMQLQDYLFNDLLPRLDSYTSVEINGEKVHASSIIKAYKDQINNVKSKEFYKQ